MLQKLEFVRRKLFENFDEIPFLFFFLLENNIDQISTPFLDDFIINIIHLY